MFKLIISFALLVLFWTNIDLMINVILPAFWIILVVAIIIMTVAWKPWKRGKFNINENNA